MNLRQRSSRYGSAVLFMAGIAGALLFVAILNSGLKPGLELWLASALVASLILHARAGFALSRAQQEIEMLRNLLNKIHPDSKKSKAMPKLKFEEAKDIKAEDAEILENVKKSIESDRIDLYLQPIVSLPQRKERYYEAFSRLRNEDGSILRPCDYLDAAERANRIGVIDNMILLRAVQALRHLGAENPHTRIFCNISPATIFDSDFFIRFTDYLDANDDLAQRLVFEFTYPAVEMMHDRVEKNLELIAKRGYAFSVDHIRRFDLNWRALGAKNFRFVKAPASLLLGALQKGPEGGAQIEEFKERLHENGMDLIVEKLENETIMPEILSLGIDFGQGELFGAPRQAAFYTERGARYAKAS